eukprot:IDg4757t1
MQDESATTTRLLRASTDVHQAFSQSGPPDRRLAYALAALRVLSRCAVPAACDRQRILSTSSVVVCAADVPFVRHIHDLAPVTRQRCFEIRKMCAPVRLLFACPPALSSRMMVALQLDIACVRPRPTATRLQSVHFVRPLYAGEYSRARKVHRSAHDGAAIAIEHKCAIIVRVTCGTDYKLRSKVGACASAPMRRFAPSLVQSVACCSTRTLTFCPFASAAPTFAVIVRGRDAPARGTCDRDRGRTAASPPPWVHCDLKARGRPQSCTVGRRVGCLGGSSVRNSSTASRVA